MEHHNHHHTAGTPGNIQQSSNHATHNKSNLADGHAGHEHHAMMIDDFRKRFFVVLILTIPVLLLSPMIQHWLNVHWQFTGSQYLLAALSSILFFYGGLSLL